MFLLTCAVMPALCDVGDTDDLLDLARAADAMLFATPEAALAHAERYAAEFDDTDIPEDSDERMRLVEEHTNEKTGLTMWLFGAAGSSLANDTPDAFVWFWLRPIAVQA